MKIMHGIMDTQLIMCPACYGNTCKVGGFDSDGRKLALHFTCECGARFDYEYIRQSDATLFSVNVVQVQAEPLG